MTTQIAVRLSDEAVEFVDDLVRSGAAASRADVIERLLARERRRLVAERDALKLAGLPRDADLDRLAAFAARVPIADLD
jgi:Arc/MetJ-type ribon-helix-helix transcriptional regulator